MNKEVFEVSKDEYTGFLAQIKKGTYYSQLEELDESHKELNIYSKKTDKLLASQVVDKEDNSLFYVYTMPDDDERKAPPAVTKIELQSQEEVEAFFKILNEARKKND